jgi:subtilisin family serine protease
LDFTHAYSYPDTELSNYFDILLSSLEEAEILFISSAGNDGVNSDSYYVYPTHNEAANYVAAASVGSDGKLSSFSNYGVKTVEIGAPGSSIYTTNNYGSYVTVDGTSFASPFSAGIAGLIWALDPSLEYWEVRNLLINAVSGKQVGTSFVEEYSGSKGDYLYMTPGISVTAYEDTKIDLTYSPRLKPGGFWDRRE